MALGVLAKFAPDIPSNDLTALIDRTYTAKAFGTDDIAPVHELESNLYLLRLSNGPTLAFKDMALQLLGNLFEYVLSRSGRTLNVLGATSGDTGSAAEAALKGKQNVSVFMLSPHGRMSPFQRAQMYSMSDDTIHNLAIKGTFDDCQAIVKELSSDLEFKRQYQLGAVNSINWGRIAAQVIYYVWAYLNIATKNQRISFVVPTGNFGNILAGYIAKQMGLPIDRLILATNENNVLDEFFSTGVYRPRSGAETHKTSSPSMDISKASNFERFIFDMTQRDPAAMKTLWQSLETSGTFDLSATPYWNNIQASRVLCLAVVRTPIGSRQS